MIASFKILMDMWLLRNRVALTERMKTMTEIELQSYEDLSKSGDHLVAKLWI